MNNVIEERRLQTERLKRLTALENVKTFNDYESTVLTHAFYPNKGENLPYPTLGLTGEAGEVANIVKKIQRDDNGVITAEKREKVTDELGDVLWYITACAEEIGLTLNDIAAYNVRKLRDRHGVKNNGQVSNGEDKFTTANAEELRCRSFTKLEIVETEDGIESITGYTPQVDETIGGSTYGELMGLSEIPHSC